MGRGGTKGTLDHFARQSEWRHDGRMRYEEVVLDKAFWLQSGDWRAYEAYIAGWLAAAYPGIVFDANVKLRGNKSGTTRQIDIMARSQNPVIIECKYYGRRVDVKCIESFLGMLDDVGISRGIIITAKGHTAAALSRAKNDPREIHLTIIPPERLSDYQFLGDPLIWRGMLGISLGLIAGWVTDTEMSGGPGGALMMMYPLGYSLANAIRRAPVIYANILSKPTAGTPLGVIAAQHQMDMADDNPTYCFSFENLILADRNQTMRQALLRKASGPPPIFGDEHALYIDYGEDILLLVLNSPPGKGETLQALLRSLYEDSFSVKIEDRRGSAAPH